MSLLIRSRRHHALLLLGLGVLLVFAAVFAPMGAIVPTYRYEVVEVSPDSLSPESEAAAELAQMEQVLACTTSEPPCHVVSRVRENGSVVVQEVGSERTPGFGHRYQVVYFLKDGEFYRPHYEHLDNGSERLRLEAISNRTAMEMASLQAVSFPREFQRLFAHGTVRTSEPIAGWKYWNDREGLVHYKGRFYRQGRFTYWGTRLYWDEYLQVLTTIAGIALLLYGRTKQLQAEETS